MARSAYVWTVMQGGVAHQVAVFTVKHELATWWALRAPDVRAHFQVWRHRDARPTSEPIDITHELETTP